MDAEKYQRAKQVFEEAIDLEPGEVQGFVTAACGDDAALRELVVRLLGWDDTGSGLDVASLGGVAMAAAAQDVDSLDTGQIIDGRYMVDQHLGAGGMASVWRVRHLRLDAWYAIKILALPHDFLRQRLLQEGQLQGRVAHRNVVAVTDMLDIAGQPALVMEFVDGPSLADFLRDSRPTRDQIDQIARGLMAGVGAAHEAGLVHRDLKPANVLLAFEDGQLIPKVADFGIARLLDPDGGTGPGLTRTGALMGTPSYMSPEQIRDARHIDHRADVWALGCILYEMITGSRAFVGEDNGEILTAVLTGDVALPRAKDYDVPACWVGAVVEALRVKPEHRPESCTALLKLWNGEAELPVELRPPPPRWPRWLLAAGVLAAIGIGGSQLLPGEDPAAEDTVTVEPVVEEPVVAPEPSVDAAAEEPPAEDPVAEEPPAEDPVVEAPVVEEPPEEAPSPEPVVTRPLPEPTPSEPVEEPAAAPVEEPPAEEPVAAAEPEPATTGSVRVTGSFLDAWLRTSSGQRVGLTGAPAGTYTLMVKFSESNTDIGWSNLEVKAGQTLSVECNKVFGKCSLR